ncbi:hypothetical protein TRVA0_046S00848 [Trichomonascus vanleenenianus]|uniref:uncharacterized protein n=1 Tax=Trichomonascus vanleenenianus TaxID=2268995 RepID=UPI003ECA775C
MNEENKFLSPNKAASGEVGGKTFDVVTVATEDQINVMIYTNGKLGRMFIVPLLASTVQSVHTIGGDEEDSGQDMLTPLPHLTPMPLVGGGGDRDVAGKLYAAIVASLVSRQAPQEKRKVMVALGPGVGPRPDEDITKNHRKELLEVVRLVQQCRVW